MNFEDVLVIVDDEPVFDSGLLLAGNVNPAYLRRQLSGWVKSQKLWQLRRGLYALAPPYQKINPHPFLVANRLVSGSYVSLQAALAYHALIPEHVAVITSVTTRRPGEWTTPLGHYLYRHIQPDLFFGYAHQPVDTGQAAFVATPAKALLDLVYLTPGGDSLAFLNALRLQNLDRLDLDQLHAIAEQSGKAKLRRATDLIVKLASLESEEYELL